MTDDDSTPHLFRPLRLRELTLKNRVVISPMCQHAANFGMANDWHFVHLGRFAISGAGLIFVESTAVDARARIGMKDVGLWSDDHVAPFRRIVDFVHGVDGRIGIQLAHAGRKTGSEALWEGGRALTEEQLDATGEPWARIGPSELPAGPGWSVPRAMTHADMHHATQAFVDATRRAERAGFDVVELHFGHGYLAASFLSPVANHRTDEYGGDIANRMRFPLEIAGAVRAAWPAEKPLFVRISALDGAQGGWSLDDSVVFAKALKSLGIDVIDCSSGGLGEQTRATNIARGLGFQVPYAERIRREAGIATQAVGIILDGPQAEDVIASGKADLVAVGREALLNPNWTVQAAQQLTQGTSFEPLNIRHASWLAKRADMLSKMRTEAGN